MNKFYNFLFFRLCRIYCLVYEKAKKTLTATVCGKIRRGKMLTNERQVEAFHRKENLKMETK